MLETALKETVQAAPPKTKKRPQTRKSIPRVLQAAIKEGLINREVGKPSKPAIIPPLDTTIHPQPYEALPKLPKVKGLTPAAGESEEEFQIRARLTERILQMQRFNFRSDVAENLGFKLINKAKYKTGYDEASERIMQEIEAELSK